MSELIRLQGWSPIAAAVVSCDTFVSKLLVKLQQERVESMIFDERLSKSTRLVADSDNRNNLRYVCIQVTCRVEHGLKAWKKDKLF